MSVSHEEFGRELASALGHGPSSSTMRAQERRLVEAIASQRRRSFGRFFSLPRLAAVLIAAIVVLGGLRIQRSSDEPAIWARANGALLDLDAVLKTRPGESQSLSFFDGSRVEMKGESAAKLVQLSPRHTKLALERGRLNLEVQHRPDNDWTVVAGNYRVRVVGTRFSVVYDQEQHDLVVEVAEGRVLVFGGELPSEGISLIAGARFTTRSLEPRPRPGAANADVTPTPRDDSASRPSAEASQTPKPGAAAHPTVEEPSWRDLAVQGKYQKAVAAAEKHGFDSLLAELSDGDLLLLANSARFSGHTGRAKQGLLELRQRFGGRPAAVLASFYLARLALDGAHDDQEAARWFRTYLSESPRGELAASARIELMNILLRAGDRAGARRIAQQYLEYHPAGAHASLARSVVDRVPAEQ